MLDETTYYFTAFALDQNNNIIDSETLSIKTSFGWKPWVNTVLYYPFKENQNDQVWNSSLSVTWVKDTLWYRFAQSGEMLVNNPPSTCIFVSFWIKRNASMWTYNQTPSSWVIWRCLYNFSHASSSYAKKFEWNQSNGTTIASSTQNTSMWTWYYFAMWYDWTTIRCYINSVKVWEQNASSKNMWSMRFWYDIDMNVSEYIWEKQIWQDIAIVDYFNKTKSKYGY